MNARWEHAAAVTIKAATRSTTVRQKTEIISLDDAQRQNDKLFGKHYWTESCLASFLLRW